MEDKKGFVAELSNVLNLAKPHLTCEYVKQGDWEEFVIVTCNNGYQYKINVTADSLAAIATGVFERMASK